MDKNVDWNLVRDLAWRKHAEAVARTDQTNRDAEKLAEIFHLHYEALAPCYNYETRPESRKPWEDVPAANKQLMVAVCRQLLVNEVVTLRHDLQSTTPEEYRAALHGLMMADKR